MNINNKDLESKITIERDETKFLIQYEVYKSGSSYLRVKGIESPNNILKLVNFLYNLK